MRMMSSPLGISQQYNSNSVYSPNVPIYNPNNNFSNGSMTSESTNSQTLQVQSDFSSVKVINPLDGSTSFLAPKVTVGTPQVSKSESSDDAWESTVANQQLARIILAERDLNLRLEHEARNRNPGNAASRYKHFCFLEHFPSLSKIYILIVHDL